MSLSRDHGLIIVIKEEDISPLVEQLKTMAGVRCSERYVPLMDKKIPEIEMDFRDVPHRFSVLATGGHLTEYMFSQKLRPWRSCDPKDLFKEKVVLVAKPEKADIIEQIRRETLRATSLLFWIYSGMENEYIAQQVVDIVRKENAQIEIHRLQIPSNLDNDSVFESFENPGELTTAEITAFSTLQSLQFKSGAAISRLTTNQMKSKFETKSLLIYGHVQAKILEFMVAKSQNDQNKSTPTAEIDNLVDQSGVSHSEFVDEFQSLLKRRLVKKYKDDLWLPTPLGKAFIEFLRTFSPEIVGQEILDIMNEHTEGISTKRCTKAFAQKAILKIFTDAYDKIEKNIHQLDNFLANIPGIKRRENQDLMRCPLCRQRTMGMWRKKDGGEAFLGCSAYPKCKGHFWFSGTVKTVGPSTKLCNCIGEKCVTLTFHDNRIIEGCLVCNRSVQDAILMDRNKYTWLLDDLVPPPTIQTASSLMPPPRPANAPQPSPPHSATPPRLAISQPIRAPLAQIQPPSFQQPQASTSTFGHKRKADSDESNVSKKKLCPDPQILPRTVRPRVAAAKNISQDENVVFNSVGVFCRCNTLASVEMNVDFALRRNENFYRCARQDSRNCGFFEWVADFDRVADPFSDDYSDLM